MSKLATTYNDILLELPQRDQQTLLEYEAELEAENQRLMEGNSGVELENLKLKAVLIRILKGTQDDMVTELIIETLGAEVCAAEVDDN